MSSTTLNEEISCASGLELLSAECLHQITQELDFYDIMALDLSGSCYLRSKLAQAVTKIDARIPPLFKWTHLPFRYRKLQSLSINPDIQCAESVFYAPGDLLIPEEGHKALESLRVSSPLAMTLLVPNSLTGAPHLSQLLPNLRTLYIRAKGDLTRAMLQDLPRTLTSLSLCLSGNYEPEASILEALPPALEKFATFSTILSGKEHIGESNRISLPATLTCLEIALSSLDPLFTSLSSNMQSLIVYGGDDETLKLKSSQFPPNLTYLALWISHPKIAMTMDSHIPITLDSFSASAKIEFLDPTTGLEISNVASFFLAPLRNFYLNSDVMAHYFPPPTIPTLEELYDCPDPLVWSKMTNLISLKVPVTVEPSSLLLLPLSLTDLTSPLTSNPTHWLEVLPKLIHLKRLAIVQSNHSAPPGFFDSLYDRLDTLSCRSSEFDTHQALNGGWTKLTSLSLTFTTVWSEFAAYANNCTIPCVSLEENSLRYPSTLKSLTISCQSHVQILWPPIAKLRHLESLILYGSFNTPTGDQSLYNFLTTLPAPLSYLCAYVPYYIEPKYLWNLPSHTRNLVLGMSSSRTANLDFSPTVDRSLPYVYHGSKEYLWTEEHVRHLPPALIEIDLQGLRMFDLSKFDHEITLPPTLMDFSFPHQHPAFEPKILKEEKRQMSLTTLVE